MWLGKAVMATAFSGNMEFMDRESSVLIDWKPVAVRNVRIKTRSSHAAVAPATPAVIERKRCEAGAVALTHSCVVHG